MISPLKDAPILSYSDPSQPNFNMYRHGVFTWSGTDQLGRATGAAECYRSLSSVTQQRQFSGRTINPLFVRLRNDREH